MDIFKEMKKFQDEMNKSFKKFFLTPEIKSVTKFRQPLSDIHQTKNEVILNIELPGIDKKDIITKIDENSVEVKAQKKAEIKVEKKGFYKHERSYAGFYRKYSLPTKVNPKKARTEYKDGILKIVMPKKAIQYKKAKLLKLK